MARKEMAGFRRLSKIGGTLESSKLIINNKIASVCSQKKFTGREERSLEKSSAMGLS